MDNSTKKLLNGSMVYFLGTALTQLMSLLLMRFVTGNITPEEYGFFNLVTTVSNLVIPFVTLQISDAVFRFVLKSQTEDEKKTYFTICFVVSLISVGVIIAAVYLLSLFFEVPHTLLVGLYVASYALFGIYQKVIRCLNRNKVFAIGNVIKITVFLALEILLISTFNMGLEALLLAHILSLVVFLVFAEIRVHALKYFDLRTLRRSAFTNMMKFSIPLIPNAAFWWLTSSVNHVIVSARLGVDVNGIYSASGKFSSALSLVTNVLNMSWQDTAIADYGKKDFASFLTKTFNTYVKLIFSAIAVLTPFVAVVAPYMLDPSYHESIQFTPFLLLAAGTSTMSGFAAQIFVGKGKTNVLFITSAVGMVANISVIALLVDKIGLWAAVLGSLTADVILFSTRIFMTRKEFAKGIDYLGFSLIFAILAIGIYLYLNYTLTVNLVWFAITAVIAVIMNFEFIKNLLTLMIGQIFKRKTKRETE